MGCPTSRRFCETWESLNYRSDPGFPLTNQVHRYQTGPPDEAEPSSPKCPCPRSSPVQPLVSDTNDSCSTATAPAKRPFPAEPDCCGYSSASRFASPQSKR